LKKVLICLLVLFISANSYSQEKLPSVLIITTGGTIASGGWQAKTGVDLVNVIPGVQEVAEITIEDFINIGSSKITPQNWRDLAIRINEVFNRRTDIDGIVVTHGTDTMEETAYFLHLTVRNPRPVVITGAMRSSNAVSADGPANLFNAIRLAASKIAKDRGVLVLMNDEIHAAREITKTNTLRLNAFETPLIGALGYTDSDKISFLRSSDPVLRDFTPFELIPDRDFPKVDIVYSYAGADGELIRGSAKAGAAGIVVATVGNGNVSTGQATAIREALGEGVIVVFSSRTGGGRVSENVGRSLAERGSANHVISARDLNAQKARVLLMLALSRTQKIKEIQEIFRIY